MCGIRDKEPRIKAAGAAGRCDGAKEEVQARSGIIQCLAGLFVQFAKGALQIRFARIHMALWQIESIRVAK